MHYCYSIQILSQNSKPKCSYSFIKISIIELAYIKIKKTQFYVKAKLVVVKFNY